MYGLKKAADFHGHLGPYLVLGLLIGDLAIKRLKCRKHFAIEAIIKGAADKPKSCLIDGIQLSTGCTYGKNNIHKAKGARIKVTVCDLKKNKKITFSFKKWLIEALNSLKDHKDSEVFAKKILTINPDCLFELKIRSN